MPSSTQQAAREFDTRKRNIVNIFVNAAQDYGFGNAGDHNDLFFSSFPRIAACLAAERETDDGSPGYLTCDGDVPTNVQEWLLDLPRGSYQPGTHALLPGDWDFVMTQLVDLLYLFTDDPDLLTNASCLHIIEEAFSNYLGQEWWPRGLRGVLDNPETENHVLMILSSIYLVNQWIHDNPRSFGNEIWEDMFGNRGWRELRGELDNTDTGLEDKLLQALARPLHNGYFETNATPYQAYSLHAISNLFAYSNTARMRTAARNALDYTAAKFAFQSFEGKRKPPVRRAHGYADVVGLFEIDPVIHVMSALSGTYDWSSTCPGEPCETYHHVPPESRQMGAALRALFAVLKQYRLPVAIHDFMLDKHSGYWARMQVRYDDSHYDRHGGPPKYFHSDGSVILDADALKPTPEFYFATNRFLNSAGGAWDRFRVEQDGGGRVENSVHYYDFLSRPQILFTQRGAEDYGEWSTTSRMENDVLSMLGIADMWWSSNNTGTYKSFAYGYGGYTHDARPLSPPYSRTIGWSSHTGHEIERSNVRFDIVDLSRDQRYGFYVVRGRPFKQESDEARYNDVERAFWEIVPRERFATVNALSNYVRRHNGNDAFTNDTEGADRFYRYTMTTGETLVLDDRLGFGEGRTSVGYTVEEVTDESWVTECIEPIRRILGPDGRELEPSDFYYSCANPGRRDMPLMEVREVDNGYQFTGRVFARATGDGRLEIHNPFVGESLLLDSSDYRNPRREIDVSR